MTTMNISLPDDLKAFVVIEPERIHVMPQLRILPRRERMTHILRVDQFLIRIDRQLVQEPVHRAFFADASAIEGGDELRLAKGDVMTIPNGVPHWFKGVHTPFRYYVIKSSSSGAKQS